MTKAEEKYEGLYTPVKEPMKNITVRLPSSLLEAIKKAVKEDHYPSEAEFYREALRDKIRLREKGK